MCRQTPTVPLDAPKKRYRFLIYGFIRVSGMTGSYYERAKTQIGYGDYYPHGGNCQIYLECEDYAAKQLASLGEVMLFENVHSIQWEKPIEFQ